MGILDTIKSEGAVIRGAPISFTLCIAAGLGFGWGVLHLVFKERLDVLNGTIARLERDLGDANEKIAALAKRPQAPSAESSAKTMDLPSVAAPMPTPPPAGKSYADLRAAYEKLTDLQGRTLVERYRGQSLTIKGKVLNVSAIAEGGSAMVGIDTPQGMVLCTFPAPLDSRLTGMRKGDPITATGKLDNMKGYGTDLAGCVAE